MTNTYAHFCSNYSTHIFQFKKNLHNLLTFYENTVSVSVQRKTQTAVMYTLRYAGYTPVCVPV